MRRSVMRKPGTSLAGHCAIVTGATGGIGACFCRELASRGCSLLLTDVSAARLADLQAGLAGAYPEVRTYTLPLDLSVNDPVGPLEVFCGENGISPDILINNAGIFSFNCLSDLPERRVGMFIDIHIRAVTMLCRWFAVRRKAEGSGRMLNMSSMSCWMPMPGLSMYSSTKAYIRVLSRSLHYEMKDYGVTVTTACPGGIATDLFGLPDNLKRLAVAIGALDTPERFAAKAVDRMMKGHAQYINGWLNRLSVFLVGVSPACVRMMVKRRLLDKGITR